MLDQVARKSINQAIGALQDISRSINANTQIQKQRYALERETFEYNYGADALRVFDNQQAEKKES